MYPSNVNHVLKPTILPKGKGGLTAKQSTSEVSNKNFQVRTEIAIHICNADEENLIRKHRKKLFHSDVNVEA